MVRQNCGNFERVIYKINSFEDSLVFIRHLTISKYVYSSLYIIFLSILFWIRTLQNCTVQSCMLRFDVRPHGNDTVGYSNVVLRSQFLFLGIHLMLNVSIEL